MDERENHLTPEEPEDDAALRLLRLAGQRQPVPPERESRVRAAVRAQWRRGLIARRRQRWLWAAVPLAAAALVVLAVGGLLRRGAPGVVVASVDAVVGRVRVDAPVAAAEPVVGTVLRAGSVVESGDDGRIALRMEGVGSVRLDTASRLVLDAPGRVVLERGAVYLDSGPAHRGEALTVVTAFARVRDIGTQLEVRLFDSTVRVRVREGGASLERAGRLGTVGSSQEATVAGEGVLRVRPLAAGDPGWQWILAIAPPFRLEGSTAVSFLSWATRETGLELRWAKPELAAAAASIALHGDIAGLRPDEAPAVVLATCGLTCRVEGGTLVVDTMTR